MSLDKKEILKEIEVLIRSIKVHYDNIENEYRIPTIELELITSKIRKLHEKSIIYNHLHYMEENAIQKAKKSKAEPYKVFEERIDSIKERVVEEKNKPAIEDNAEIVSELEPESTTIHEVAITESEDKPIAENKLQDETQSIVEMPIENQTAAEEKTSYIPPPLAQTTESNGNTASLKVNIKLGINDRFRFIKHLFNGNGAAMENAIKELEQCKNIQELSICVNQLKSKFNWDNEDENVTDFLGLLPS
ncbi:MAG: hypothetical protein IT238_06205 [Bacteroidia bacterium]|nr:hypothetical protein [Bacteroidia bacterium]MCZ2249875.1 hypothetical protein [Bacteroidia bacterium]